MRWVIGCRECVRTVGVSLYTNVLRFHLKPLVVKTVEPIPTGSNPQVFPNALWLMCISCSPLLEVWRVNSRLPKCQTRESYGVENPCNVVVRDYENRFALLSKFVEVRKGVDGLVEST